MATNDRPRRRTLLHGWDESWHLQASKETGSKMKHWRNDGGEDSIVLDTGEGPSVVSITVRDDSVEFRECCDNFYHVELSRDDAIEALREAIAWIESQ